MDRPTVFHIPVCPFSQRLEILLALKGRPDAVRFQVVDVTKPRDPALLAKTQGKTALPVLETEHGGILRESMVLLQYLDDRFPEPRVARSDPYERAVENLLASLATDFATAGYTFVMNQDRGARARHAERMLDGYAEIDAFLQRHAPKGPFLFDAFGWAEAVFTPLFMRFWFLDYYEEFVLPEEPRFARVGVWRRACLAHPAAQQVTEEEIVKLYYDYALGSGNGALVPGRMVSSFAQEPHWKDRPMPPRAKYDVRASDAELGLLRKP